MREILSTWLRAGRLGEHSISAYIGIGPWDLWFGWRPMGSMGDFRFSVLPGSDPIATDFDYWFDLVLGRFRLSLVWLGPRPEFWAQ